MSIFGNLMGKIFGAKHPAVASANPEMMSPANASADAPAASSGSASAAAASAAPTGNTAEPVDVEKILDGMAAKNPEKLDWRKSIVDLMKLVGLDSSLSARKELAHELHYTGSTDDSATMNIWLHKQVMTKLAENGGKVPADLKH